MTLKVNEIRITLDNSLGRRLGNKWEKISKSVRKSLVRALKENDYIQAYKIVNDLDLSEVVKGNTRFIKFIAAEAMVLGANQLSDISKLQINRKDQTKSIAASTDLLMNALIVSTETLQKELRVLIEDHQVEFIREGGKLFKRHLNLPEIEDLVNTKTLKGGFAGIDINSSLMNSRMSSLGFTLEAESVGVEFYKIQAILDSRTGDLDQRMNGTTFQVSAAKKTLDTGFANNTPEGWKVNQPWFKVNKESLASIDKMSMGQMVNANIHLPPFHPGCRCIIVQSSQEAFIDFVQDTSLVLSSAAQPDFIFGRLTKTTVTDKAIEGWNRLKFGKPEVYIKRLLGTDVAVDSVTVFNVKGTEAAIAYELETPTISITRFIDIKNKKVDHSFFKVPPDKPGTFKRVYKESIQSYVTAGLSTVTLEVSNTGGYAWAKYGFKPSKKDWRALRDDVLPEWEGVRDQFPREVQEEIDKLFNARDPETIWKISDLTPKINGVPLGRFLLEGRIWNGELGLHDAAAMRRFKNYIG